MECDIKMILGAAIKGDADVLLGRFSTPTTTKTNLGTGVQTCIPFTSRWPTP